MTRTQIDQLSMGDLLVASFSGALRAQTSSARPTIVLVHGAFADGSSWERVIPMLQRDGYNVIAVQNPLASLAVM
jgi:pimeloyl-ACP methyl ester carboxylesterase